MGPKKSGPVTNTTTGITPYRFREKVRFGTKVETLDGLGLRGTGLGDWTLIGNERRESHVYPD